MSKKHEKIWNAYFGNASEAKDAFGIVIYRDKYANNLNSMEKGSWTLDHIFPIKPYKDNFDGERRGSNSLYNLQPLSIESNAKKGPHLAGKVNGITFSIKIIEQHENNVTGRMMIKKNNNWFWAYNY